MRQLLLPRLIIPALAAFLLISASLILLIDGASPPGAPKASSGEAVGAVNVATGATLSTDQVNKIIADKQAQSAQQQSAALAAQKAEEIRARLQSHVENHVNKLLSEKNAAQGGGGKADSSHAQKLELKIDLPPDLAQLVHGQGGAAVKINRVQHAGKDVPAQRTVSPAGGATGGSTKGTDEAAGAGKDRATKTKKTVCSLGYYTDMGWAPTATFDKCEPCPEGTTTMKQGSTSCVTNPSEEEMLGMLYELVNGGMWNERQKRGWKSDAPACTWEGITCDGTGEIIGVAFPMIGFRTDSGEVLPVHSPSL